MFGRVRVEHATKGDAKNYINVKGSGVNSTIIELNSIDAPSPEGRSLEPWRILYRPYCINSMTLGETQSGDNRHLETKVLGTSSLEKTDGK